MPRRIVQTTDADISQGPVFSQSNSYTPILVVLLLVASFLLGMFFDRVQNLEKKGNGVLAAATQPTGQQAAQPTTPPVKPLHIAKAIGMDANKFKTCLESGKYTQQVAADLADGQKAGVNGTPATFIDGQLISGAQPYNAFKTILDQEIQNPNAPLPTGTRAQVDPGTLSGQGSDSAPVTIIEFADFQCPFCERFFSDVEPSIIKDYVNSGKVKFYFRNYAFLGPDSNTTAEGAYCANDQGKFWDYHNFLYSHQGQENSGEFSKANLL